MTLGGTFVSFLDKRKDNKEKNKPNNYGNAHFLIISLGIILTLVSGFIAANDKMKSDTEALKSENKRVESDSLLFLANQELQKKSNFIIKMEEENKKDTKNLNSALSNAKDSIIYVQSETLNQVTGENSFPLASFNMQTNSQVFMQVDNKGTSPLYDVVLQIATPDQGEGMTTFEDSTIRKLGTIGVGLHSLSMPLALNITDLEKSYKFYYRCRNGDYEQWVKIRQTGTDNGPFLTANIVFRVKGKNYKKIYESVAQTFLNKNEKKVNWSDFIKSKRLEPLPKIRIIAYPR